MVSAVCDDHTYKDEKLFYRFRKDDGSYKEPADSAILAKGQRLYSRSVAQSVWSCMWHTMYMTALLRVMFQCNTFYVSLSLSLSLSPSTEYTKACVIRRVQYRSLIMNAYFVHPQHTRCLLSMLA